jgi:hypothetical protein
MARRGTRVVATREEVLSPLATRCWTCEQPLWIAYANRRTITTLQGSVRLRLNVRRCRNPGCPRYHLPYRPEAEGGWALPKHEFGLDVIALVGTLRFRDHRSVSEIRQDLQARGVTLAERTVTNLLHRYEELVAVRLADANQLQAQLQAQGRVLVALDGLQPDVGHEVLWVVRDCVSGVVLLARSLLGATEAELVPLLEEVRRAVPVPIQGVISDGQQSIRNAVRTALPGVPHQLCQFHYLREAAKPIYEADRHAKKELKKHVRGVRPIERMLEGVTDPEAAVSRAYCLAVRSALTDDGRPPLCASGLRLVDRLQAIQNSLDRVAAKRGSPSRWPACINSSRGD